MIVHILVQRLLKKRKRHRKYMNEYRIRHPETLVKAEDARRRRRVTRSVSGS
jgi:hypothetical protein